MRKIYAACGNLFTGRVLCHLVMFLTAFFHLMYKMEWSYYIDYFCHSWLVCLLGYWLRNMPLVKAIGNPISDGIVFVFHLV